MVDQTPLIAENTCGKKQGHRVLCCCDSRKATIIIALVSLVFSIAALVYVAIIDTNIINSERLVLRSLNILYILSLTICAQMTFVSEVGREIMSPAAHDPEKYSCCCNV